MLLNAAHLALTARLSSSRDVREQMDKPRMACLLISHVSFLPFLSKTCNNAFLCVPGMRLGIQKGPFFPPFLRELTF